LSDKQIQSIKAASRCNAFGYLDDCGLLSFSLTAEDPLLWGHYAASFKGICAVFKRGSSMQSGLCVCAEVCYVENRPELPLSLLFALGANRMQGKPFDELANEVFFLSFLHKDKHWAYEQEARIFYPFRALKTITFDPHELIGFIFAPNSSRELRDRLTSEVKAKRPDITLSEATLSSTEFKITIPSQYQSLKIAV
jgi:hypothetical protein